MTGKKEILPTQIVRCCLAYDRDKPKIATHEYQLLTDVNVYGEARDVGPFDFINTIAHAGASNTRGLRPAAALRIHYIETGRSVVRFDDNFEHYSGGDLTDEVAALCTLMLGVRIVAGSLKREYNSFTDPLGSPRDYATKLTPFFQADYNRLRVPRANIDTNITSLQMITRLIALPNKVSSALIKSARLYQQGLLLCETLPEMAWLLFVSALETVAAEHAFKVSDRFALFKKSYPDISELLIGFDEVQEALAAHFFPLSRSKAKFADFIKTFIPPPPAQRPPPAYCFDMSEPDLEAGISAIYKHRSTHLHGGTAFPAPMCEPPRYWKFPDHPAHGFQEKPMGHGANYSGASWSAASCPMLLHHFEYITRGCILRWWASNDPEISVNVDDRELTLAAA